MDILAHYRELMATRTLGASDIDAQDSMAQASGTSAENAGASLSGPVRSLRDSPKGHRAGDAVGVPTVCVIATVRNEERYIEAALDSVLSQDYPVPFNVVVAVGPSHDNTYGLLKEYVVRDPRVVLVENPSGLIPHGLNIAIDSCPPETEVIVRFDGHTRLPDGYIKNMVDALNRSGADNVGGLMKPVGKTSFERAIARGMSHPLGIGSASFHVGGIEGPEETAYLGTFRKQALDRVGKYNEHFQRAEDWELNLRIRESGGLIWFTPDVEVEYRPRSNFKMLAQQFGRTGQWRREVIRLNRSTASLRYLAPPIAVGAMIGGTAVALLGLILGLAGNTWAWWLLAGLGLPLGYGALMLIGGAWASRGLPIKARILMPFVLATMHISWGSGFLFGRST